MKKIMMSLLILSSFNLFSANENLIRKISVTGNSEKEVINVSAVELRLIEITMRH